MRELQAIARLTIHPGKLEELERLAAACVRVYALHRSMTAPR